MEMKIGVIGGYMRLHFGPIPGSLDFVPEAPWRAVKEPPSKFVPFLAFPIGVVVAVLLSWAWFVLTPLRLAEMPVPTLPVFLVGCMAIVFAHELLHAVVHPMAGWSSSSVLGFWPKHVVVYAHYDGELTRNRFLAIALMPFVLISVLPLFAACIMQISCGWAALISISNALLGCADILGAGIVLLQIPRCAIVRNQGSRTYWRTIVIILMATIFCNLGNTQAVLLEDSVGTDAGSAYMKQQVEGLRAYSFALREKASRIVAERGEESVIFIIPLLKDKSWQVRAHAARTLGAIKSSSCISPLVPLLEDDNAYVRINAVWALGMIGIGDEKTMIEIMKCLQDENRYVRMEAIRVLRQFGVSCEGTALPNDVLPKTRMFASNGKVMVKLFYHNYYLDPGVYGGGDSVAPVERKVQNTAKLMQETLNLLLEGKLTGEEENDGFNTGGFPGDEFEIIDATLKNGELILRFKDPKSSSSGGSCRTGILQAEVMRTAMQFPGVKSVILEPDDLFQP